jgi:hypothetical protein
MKVRYLLLISFLIVGTLFIPAVSAEILEDTEYSDYFAKVATVTRTAGTSSQAIPNGIIMSTPLSVPEFEHMFAQMKSSIVSNYASLPSSGQANVKWYIVDDNGITGAFYMSGTYGYFKYTAGGGNWLQIWAEFNDPAVTLTGPTYLKCVLQEGESIVWPMVSLRTYKSNENAAKAYNNLVTDTPGIKATFGNIIGTSAVFTLADANNVKTYPVVSGTWKNGLRIETIGSGVPRAQIDIIKEYDGYFGVSDHYVTFGETVYSDLGGASDIQYIIPESEYPFSVSIYNAQNNKWYNSTYGEASPDDPDDPDDQTGLRKGSVTMTDHNGTAISGFEVTAVNHYTGEEYTVSTDTDVAVMELPMDRTIEIRNPQTGVYEEAPVGYYRFYGQKPGYKMLNEEGVKVSVMPEKYSPYKLCEILVTSDSGPLTGKHQFQLRSASDNSILQTGTISAKSRTTGIWYNTTVTNGIANLVLAYDTSDALSEYAGHYYVYATSPGYEDIDYAVQVAVYPRTIYEVRSIYLIPIGGVPTPGNVTLRIQAISETGQSVDNAEIFIAGVMGAGEDVWDTYTTSWTGFIEVSVPGNSTYDIVARAAGYYDSSKRIQVFTENPPIIEMYLFLSGAPTVEPTTEPTGWVTGPPTTQPTSGIPDEDDGSGGFLMEAVRGIGNAFGVGFATAKIILGMLLALAIGFATAKQLRGGAAEFGLGLLGGTMLGILVGLIPVWTIVVLLLVVGLYIGNRYVGGANNG